MLVMTATQPLTRVQGAFVSEEELKRVVDFLKLQGKPVYDDSILKARDGVGEGSRDNDLEDPVYDQAMELVAQMDEVSVSKLQREMRLGYNKAAKIIERMEREGLVGPPNGVKPRQVLMRGGHAGRVRGPAEPVAGRREPERSARRAAWADAQLPTTSSPDARAARASCRSWWPGPARARA